MILNETMERRLRSRYDATRFGAEADDRHRQIDVVQTIQPAPPPRLIRICPK